jgi:hypothetical protein
MQRQPGMSTHSKLGVVSLVTTVALAACAHAERSDPAVPGTVAYHEVTVGVANTQASDNDQWVVEQLAAARCDREQRCGNVGDARSYASRNVCLDTMRGSIGNALNAYNCPLGIDRANLERCRVAIHEEHCGDAVATVSRAQTCRTAALCLK